MSKGYLICITKRRRKIRNRNRCHLPQILRLILSLINQEVPIEDGFGIYIIVTFFTVQYLSVFLRVSKR
jgi:hypothetical protein